MNDICNFLVATEANAKPPPGQPARTPDTGSSGEQSFTIHLEKAKKDVHKGKVDQDPGDPGDYSGEDVSGVQPESSGEQTPPPPVVDEEKDGVEEEKQVAAEALTLTVPVEVVLVPEPVIDIISGESGSTEEGLSQGDSSTWMQMVPDQGIGSTNVYEASGQNQPNKFDQVVQQVVTQAETQDPSVVQDTDSGVDEDGRAAGIPVSRESQAKNVNPTSQDSAPLPGVQPSDVPGSEPVFSLKPAQVNVTPEMPQTGTSQIQEKAPEVVVRSSTQDQQVEPGGKEETNVSTNDPPPEPTGVSGNQQISEMRQTEPARLAEAHHPEIVEQLTRGIDTLTKSGEQSIRLQLYPENLGKIDLRLASGTDGVRIVMHADSSVTNQLLERHMPELRQVLVQSGVNLSGLSIGYGNPQGQTTGFDGRRPNPWQLHKKMNGFLDLDDPGTEGQQKMESMSYIDYRI
jgi:hypothetical protein